MEASDLIGLLEGADPAGGRLRAAERYGLITEALQAVGVRAEDRMALEAAVLAVTRRLRTMRENGGP